jgi:hypothetical protein
MNRSARTAASGWQGLSLALGYRSRYPRYEVLTDGYLFQFALPWLCR